MQSNNIDSKLGSVFGKYKGYKTVTMPPTWKEREPVVFTFVIFEEELTRPELYAFFNICTELLVPNPRPVSRQLLELSSIFHPLFFESFTSVGKNNLTSNDSVNFLSQVKRCELTAKMESAIEGASALFYLQSLLFLAGCTLSAAVIQNRFSPGTIESKLNRLWQASQHAKRFDLAGFNALNVDEFVVECDKLSASDTISSLVAIKKMYGEALKSLLTDMIFERVAIKQDALSQDDKIRFGFADNFRATLGGNLQCILIYGSSVTSQSFADYDAVFVVNDATQRTACAIDKIAPKSLSGNCSFSATGFAAAFSDSKIGIGCSTFIFFNLRDNFFALYDD
jgi:hypothetical protein